MNKSKKSLIQTVVFMIMIAVVIVGCYFVIRDKKIKREEAEEKKAQVKTEVQKLLVEDIEASYPQTPRAVLKLYSRILECLINETMTTEELAQMTSQLRILFDEEFLDNNEYDDHVAMLGAEVNAYQENERTLFSTNIESAISVEEWEVDGKTYSRLIAAYTMKQGSKFDKVYEEFLLKKNETGLWKIVGWRKVDESEMEK